MLAVGADAGERIERFRSLWLVEAFLDEFRIAQNGCKRGSELVAHVGHELVLVLARDLEVLDGLGKLTRTRLHLLEKPRVFNRDYGLVRKGIDELNLTFSERAHFGAPNENRANCIACVDQRDGQRSAKTHLKRYLLALGVFICFG